MRILIQRVLEASVHVQGQEVARIGRGLLAYVGVSKADHEVDLKRVVQKILGYRVFEHQGRLQHAALDQGLELLLVSQFTLVANTQKGLRPSFDPAMPPEAAKVIYEQLVRLAREEHGALVKSGVFGADMQVMSLNDGPINFLLEF